MLTVTEIPAWTVIVAAPQTAAFTVEQAWMPTEAAATPVTLPFAAAVALATSRDFQVTVVAKPESALTEATSWTVWPIEMVAPSGATLTLWTTFAGPTTVTSSPQAATPAATSPDHSSER